MKCYLYQGTEYRNEREVRHAIFQTERKVFSKCVTADDWAKHNVEVKEITPVVTEEQMAREIRYKRDALLSKSDYYVMPDYPSTEDALAQVKAYRQALRDLTKQPSFPNMVTWPDKPSVL